MIDDMKAGVVSSEGRSADSGRDSGRDAPGMSQGEHCLQDVSIAEHVGSITLVRH